MGERRVDVMRKQWMDRSYSLILQCYIFEILKVFKDEIIIIFFKYYDQE